MESILRLVMQWLLPILSLISLIEDRKLRTTTAMSGAPRLRVNIDYAPGNNPIEVTNSEGRGAYHVRLDRFSTREGREQFFCSFDPIDYLAPGQSARFEATLEDASGRHERSRGILEALRQRSSFNTGLILRLHYRESTMRYVVHVRMPSTMFMDARLEQPNCSPPIPLTWLNAAVEMIRWSLLVGFTLAKIRRERRFSPRAH